nr:hypothetical protein [Variovorax boronicumulans]
MQAIKSKLNKQAEEEQDHAKKEELLSEAKKWDENGKYKVAMNIIIGAAGEGMTGAVTSATKETLSWAADQMRQAMIEDSKKFPGICDSNNFCLNNRSGESAGIKGEKFKLAGGRVDIQEICKYNRCIEGELPGTWKTDENGIIIMREYDDAGNKISLATLLEANPQWRSPLGGFQGKPGKFMFLGDYPPGGILDKISEAYAGDHDMLNSGTWYGPDGNIKPGMTDSEKIIGEAINKLNVVLATPFALSVLLPTEVWTAIGVALKK